jgi:hypothetical protein
MVRAILEGRKTQTRRVVRPQPGEEWCPEVGMVTETLVAMDGEAFPGRTAFGAADEGNLVFCPYGAPGDRLWVRETWCAWDTYLEDVECDEVEGDAESLAERGITRHHITYRADKNRHASRWRPSIYMPRWASRITLEITAMRVERLQDITEEDADREGCPHTETADGTCRFWFRDLWDSINSKRGFSWDMNPLVWVITFKRLEGGAK